MIVISVRPREFDPSDIEHANSLRDICAVLKMEPMVDIRPHKSELLASKSALARLTSNVVGLGFLSNFCGISQDMLIEFVLAYNPTLEFDAADDAEDAQTLEMFKQLLAHYKSHRSVN